MHPPFYIPDTFVSQDITPHGGVRRVTPRGETPRRLTFLPMPGWPPRSVQLTDQVPPRDPVLPSGRPAVPVPVLAVVPAARSTWRDIVGRFLIRTGQRMILQNGPG